jgi:hypothetical protein
MHWRLSYMLNDDSVSGKGGTYTQVDVLDDYSLKACVSVCVCVHLLVSLCVYACMCASAREYVCGVCVCVCVCEHVWCVYMYVCV